MGNMISCILRNTLTKQPTSFLSLPRELRQQILAETYDMEEFVDRFLRILGTSYASNYPYPFAPKHISRECDKVLEGIDEWTRTLKDVHEDMVEDVEYIVGRDKMIQTLRRTRTRIRGQN